MKNIHKTGPQGNVRVQQLGMTFGCFVALIGAICMVSRQGLIRPVTVWVESHIFLGCGSTAYHIFNKTRWQSPSQYVNWNILGQRTAKKYPSHSAAGNSIFKSIRKELKSRPGLEHLGPKNPSYLSDTLLRIAESSTDDLYESICFLYGVFFPCASMFCKTLLDGSRLFAPLKMEIECSAWTGSPSSKKHMQFWSVLPRCYHPKLQTWLGKKHGLETCGTPFLMLKSI